LAVRLLVEAQRRVESCAWITERLSTFFPPDAAENGVDLRQLAVVRLREARSLAPAAETLLRSGGFGLVVIDLVEVSKSLVGAAPEGRIPEGRIPEGRIPEGRIPEVARVFSVAVQSRLAALARRHRAIVLCLTEKSREQASLGALVGVRLQVARARADESCEQYGSWGLSVSIIKGAAVYSSVMDSREECSSESVASSFSERSGVCCASEAYCGPAGLR